MGEPIVDEGRYLFTPYCELRVVHLGSLATEQRQSEVQQQCESEGPGRRREDPALSRTVGSYL